MHQPESGEAYFIYHSVGQYAEKARDMAAGLAEFATVWGSANDAQWPYALGLRTRYGDLWRALLNAPEGTVTATENVTAALHTLITSLPREVLAGKRLLVAADCFPSVHFLLNGLQESLGYRLDTVPLRQGASWVEDEDFAAAWGPDVGLALLTWVSSTSSHKIDVAALTAHGRAMGSLIGVDITQGAGLLPFDVMAPAVDFTISTSLKWMCGSPGAGMLHVSETLIPACAPTLRGWFSQPNPFNWDITKFSYAPDIRRFDNGTPGIMACAATVPALEWHARQDKAALLAHNRALTRTLEDGVKSLGLRLLSPQDPAQRGGSIMAQMPASAPAPDVLARLRAREIYADARGQTLRMSPGIMTTAAGVDRLLTELTEAMAAAR